MIHAENGDMIEWLTGKFNAGRYMTTADLDTEKLESKGMVGKFFLAAISFSFADL